MMMSDVVAATVSPGGSAPASLSQILCAVREHLGMEVAFISEFVNGRRVFRHVETAAGKQCIEVGGSDPLEESYCYWISEGQLSQLICDPAEHPLTQDLPATKSLPVGAHLSVPIRLRDGALYGTFCCFSFEPDRSLTARDLATMEAFAQIAADQIQLAIDSCREREAKLRRIRGVLRTRGLQVVFQPAVKLEEEGLEFVEALSRFYGKPYQTPDRWFAAAAEVGLGAELELLAVATALEGLAQLPEQIALSINVSPDTILHAEFASVIGTAPLDRIIIEVTEHETVSSYPLLNRALGPLRKRGLRVAIDDMGAGYSSLRHILQVKPDLIKLDMSLTRDIDKDPARKVLASALVSLSHGIGSRLVAEGVETQTELDALRSLGVDACQGFFLGRPRPLLEQKSLLRGAA